MQIVINISKEDLDAIKYLKAKGWASRHELQILNGTPLPKGHGRLIDADELKTHFVGTEQGTDIEVYLESTIIDAPTIIDADKEVDNADNN